MSESINVVVLFCTFVKEITRRRKKADQQRRWRRANKKEWLRRVSESRSRNREKHLLKERANYAKNKKKIGIQQSIRYRKNPEKFKRLSKAFFKTEKGKAVQRHSQHKRRCAKLKTESMATSKQVYDFLAASVKCEYCGVHFSDGKKATLDHRTPLSKNGAHSLDNFAAACLSCNSRKHANSLDEFYDRLMATF